MIIVIHVVGDPQAQPRESIATIHGKAHAYTPKDHPIHAWKQVVTLAAMPHLQAAPMERGVGLELLFNMQKAKGSKALVAREDLDNLAAPIMNVLTKLEFWKDDKQVVVLYATKQWTPFGKDPGVLIMIREVPTA